MNRSRKQTFPSPPSTSVLARIPSNVFIVNPPPFFTVTCRFLVAVIRCRFTFQNLSLTWALTSFSFAIYSSACIYPEEAEATLGSCTKAPPLVLGGISPVVAYLRHSMIVYSQLTTPLYSGVELTVFPLPLCPTITVKGE
jgi:hypothetical protein